MKKIIWIVALLSFAHISSACGSVEAPSIEGTNDVENVENTNDADDSQDTNNTPDVGLDAENTPDVGLDAENTPDVEPPVSVCTRTEQSCGSCDLGVLTHCTDENDPLHEDCEIPDILDELECTSLIFVDGETGSDTAAGTKQAPLKTMTAGIAKAQNNKPNAIIVAGNGNSGEQAGPINVSDGISIIGGYDSKFIYTPENRVKVVAPQIENQNIFGLVADNIQSPTIISNLEITTSDASPGGYSNFAIHSKNSKHLQLSNLIATAGEGGPGTDGKPGKTYDNVSDEIGKGKDARTFTNFTSSSFGEGGKNNFCNPNSGNPDGGNGGQGRILGNQSDTAAERGKDSSSGTPGGHAGNTANPGGDGSNGDVAPKSEAGTGGKSVLDPATLWAPGKGNGKHGENGRNGHGGGGGGGAYELIVFDSKGGHSGAGGGAGGCGGDGGTAGQEGGASFGLFVVGSDITVHDSVFNAGNGGPAGHGGGPGKGQPGKLGGQSILPGNSVSANSKAGHGGKGNAGADGGPGGGGAGGISIGAYCHGSTTTFENTVFSHGLPGHGGPGGSNLADNTPPANGNPDDGEPGQTAKSFGCN